MRKFWNRVLCRDLRFRIREDVTLRVIVRPGAWMAPDACASLVAELGRLVRRTIGRPLDYGIFSGDPDRLREAVVAVLYDNTTGRPVACNASAVLDVEADGRRQRVLHLGLLVVDPAFRVRGLSRVLCGLTYLMVYLRNGLRPMWISNVSQVPMVVGRVAEAFDDVHPDPFRPSCAGRTHLAIARALLVRHRRVFGVGDDAAFDARRFVIENAYTGGSDNLRKTWRDAPSHRDRRANAMCARLLDYARGDDVLQIGRIDFGTFLRYLRDMRLAEPVAPTPGSTPAFASDTP